MVAFALSSRAKRSDPEFSVTVTVALDRDDGAKGQDLSAGRLEISRRESRGRERGSRRKAPAKPARPAARAGLGRCPAGDSAGYPTRALSSLSGRFHSLVPDE